MTQKVLSLVVGKAVGTGEQGVEVEGWKDLSDGRGTRNPDKRRESLLSFQCVRWTWGAPKDWAAVGERRGADEDADWGFKVFMSILRFHPRPHTPCHHPGLAGLHCRLSPLNL